MSKSIINLTTPIVVAEIERILETYPHHPYQQVFSNPDIRQELIAYVLTRVHNVYVTVDEGEKIASDLERSSNPAESPFELDAFIQQGIHDIMQQSQATVDHQVPEEDGY